MSLKMMMIVVVMILVDQTYAQCPGACQPNSYPCGGYYQAGLCPGPDDVQCCVEATPSCPGQCLWTDLGCDGNFESGLCPGPSDVECCVSGGGGGSGCAGSCQPTSYSCPSNYIAGLCPGDSSIECCPEPTSCNGQCQLNSLPCNGNYLVGDCPGPDDIQCCSSSGGGGGGGVQGVDLSTLTSQSSFSCLAGNGYSFVIPRCYMSTGSPDPNCPSTIRNARAAGISNIGIYMFPCPTCSASAQTQVQQAVNYLQDNGVSYNVFWLDIEGPQYWSSSISYNQQFFAGLISQLTAMGQTIGVYTSASQWNPIMGSSTAGSPYPLWYAHYDDNPSFSDFSPFGGWTKPTLKQFEGDVSVCGAGVDINWGPTAP